MVNVGSIPTCVLFELTVSTPSNVDMFNVNLIILWKVQKL